MAKKSRLKIKGTKDFLVAAVVCVFLCLWAIRDAWFPTERILKKHPLSFDISASVPGVIQSVPVEAGDEISKKTVLAVLSEKPYQKAVDAATAAYETARENKTEDLAEKLVALKMAREDLAACTVYNTDFTLKTSHGEDILQGKVLEILAPQATQVEAGETIMTVQPKDTFYIFNQTLAVLSLIGAIVSLILHGIASK